MLYQIFSLLLDVAVSLVAGTCLLRLYMQWQRINLSLRLGNPLAPFIFSLTNWLVLPLRRILPALGRLDTACLLGAYAVVLAKLTLLWWWSGAAAHFSLLTALAGVELLFMALSGLSWLVIAYALLSWFRGAVDLVFFSLATDRAFAGSLAPRTSHVGRRRLLTLGVVAHHQSR